MQACFGGVEPKSGLSNPTSTLPGLSKGLQNDRLQTFGKAVTQKMPSQKMLCLESYFRTCQLKSCYR